MSELLQPSGPPSWQERLALLAPSLAGRSRRQLALLALGTVVAVIVAVVALVWLFRAPPPPVELALPRATTSVPSPDASGATGSGGAPGPSGAAGPPGAADAAVTTMAAEIVVQAAGGVVHPGVYRLPAGARVHDLLAAAGGPVAGAEPDRLALAAPLLDGQRVHVPLVGEALEPTALMPAGGTVGSSVPTGPLDLNAATPAQLDALPGVGPATSAAIVAYRAEHGPFASVDGLLDVAGIGPAKLEALRDLVRV